MKITIFLMTFLFTSLGFAQEFIPMKSSVEGLLALSKGAGKVRVESMDSLRGAKLLDEKLSAIGFTTTANKKEAKVVIKMTGTFSVIVQGETRVSDSLEKLLSTPGKADESGAGITSLVNAPAGSILSDPALMSSLQQYTASLIKDGVGTPAAQSCLPGSCATTESMTQRLTLDTVKTENAKSEKLSLTMETTSSRLLPHLLLDAALINLTSRWAE